MGGGGEAEAVRLRVGHLSGKSDFWRFLEGRGESCGNYWRDLGRSGELWRVVETKWLQGQGDLCGVGADLAAREESVGVGVEERDGAAREGQ